MIVLRGAVLGLPWVDPFGPVKAAGGTAYGTGSRAAVDERYTREIVKAQRERTPAPTIEERVAMAAPAPSRVWPWVLGGIGALVGLLVLRRVL